MIHIVVDSTVDLDPAVVQAAGIRVVPIIIHFGQETMLDTAISRDAFYRRLVEASEIPRTAAPGVGMFEQVFRELVAQGDQVLSISVAAQLSSTFAAAQQGARLVENGDIRCVESGTTIACYGEIALAAARSAHAGASMDELLALVETLKLKAVTFVGLDTLRYLEKGGRIGRMQAFLGTMLAVKPIMEVRAGEIHPVERVRTTQRVPGRLVELAKDRGAYQVLRVIYTTDRAAAGVLADQLAQAGLMPRDQIDLVQAGPALGTHVGPGALGVAGLLQ
ncbi:MAG: DegV family protein [Roseiflexaceae bacterium]|nr:DegV family protein [Roseiflexaceae bacterium]